MSDTDIYKNREAMPMGKKPEKKKRRRRSRSQRSFDDHSSRKRRSKNSGFRRFLHLSRKSDSEKMIWSTMGVLLLAMLIIIAIWQFVIAEQLIRKQEKEAEYIEYQPHIPNNVSDGTKESLLP